MHFHRRSAVVCALLILLAACAGRAPANDLPADDDDDAAHADDDSANGADDDDNDASPGNVQTLAGMFASMGFEKYLSIIPAKTEEGEDGFTFYYFDESEVRCFNGSPARVAVKKGSSDNVMIYLEGGGARWPGGGGVFSVDTPVLNFFKLPLPENPVSDWNFVYVPYCDGSMHLGNAIVDYDTGPAAQLGVRHTAAAVALMKKLFPNPQKALMIGSSAGGYGALFGWPMMKSQYMNIPTYLISDSGVGFWNPDDPATWAAIEASWNVQMPPQCAKCQGPVMTYMFETFMDLDPQVRIALSSSYYDRVITLLFLQMAPEEFKQDLLKITGDVEAAHPQRFHRFFVAGHGHTLIGIKNGPYHEIDSESYYQWIGQLVNDDPNWGDLLE